jgi:hypothetical protein
VAHGLSLGNHPQRGSTVTSTVNIRELDFKVVLHRQQAPAFATHDEHILGQLPDHELRTLEVKLALPVVLHAQRGPAADKFGNVLGS